MSWCPRAPVAGSLRPADERVETGQRRTTGPADYRPSRESHGLRCSRGTTPTWQPGQAWIAAAGGADCRSAKNAAAPINQSREAHHTARPLHSPERGQPLQVAGGE
jgi:hypothetical protein